MGDSFELRIALILLGIGAALAAPVAAVIVLLRGLDDHPIPTDD